MGWGGWCSLWGRGLMGWGYDGPGMGMCFGVGAKWGGSVFTL